MNYVFQFAHPWIAFFALVIVILGFLWRMQFYQVPVYFFAFTSLLKKHGYSRGQWRNYFLNFLRLISLGLLAFASGRPQKVDTNSRIELEGIDIMMVLDVSGSMELFDDMKDRRTRIHVAKQEGNRFIDKRDYDQIGLVLFGNEALARLPLTLDKEPVKEVVDEIEIGLIDPSGTVLFTGIAAAANRLRHSKAKSKVMIVLTDGEPKGNDLPPNEVMDFVKRMGIKIYTIGIGGKEGGLFEDPGWGIFPAGAPLNEQLLMKIADHTGGKYFAAKKPDDMRKIYEIIDELEKTETETPIYTQYYELGIPLLLVALLLMMLEIILRSLIWKTL